jgi:hypothetical protein
MSVVGRPLLIARHPSNRLPNRPNHCSVHAPGTVQNHLPPGPAARLVTPRWDLAMQVIFAMIW